MKKLVLIAAAVAVAPALAFTAPVFADSPGQLSNSADFYKVKNETKSGSYSSSTTATCGDVVKYSVMIANSEFGQLTNVNVKTTLAGATTVSATTTENKTTSVNGNVTVNVDKGSLQYVAGSTKNLSEGGALIKNLADGITTTGVNKGNLAGSTAEFVQFQAKVVCETTPVTPTTPETPKTPEAPKQAPAVIAATGPASAIASLFGISALAAAVTYYVRSRRANILG